MRQAGGRPRGLSAWLAEWWNSTRRQRSDSTAQLRREVLLRLLPDFDRVEPAFVFRDDDLEPPVLRVLLFDLDDELFVFDVERPRVFDFEVDLDFDFDADLVFDFDLEVERDEPVFDFDLEVERDEPVFDFDLEVERDEPVFDFDRADDFLEPERDVEALALDFEPLFVFVFDRDELFDFDFDFDFDDELFDFDRDFDFDFDFEEDFRPPDVEVFRPEVLRELELFLDPDPLRRVDPPRRPELDSSPSPESSPSPSSSEPISFLATPTAAGIATPSAVPATTFCVVERPSSSSFDMLTSCAAACGPRLLRVVERLDEPGDDALPQDLGPVCGDVLAGRLRSVVGKRQQHVRRRVPTRLGCGRDDPGADALGGRRAVRAAVLLRARPLLLVVVRHHLADGDGRGRCRRSGRSRLQSRVARPARKLVLDLVLYFLCFLLDFWHA
jgi:hypothetical protein